MTKILFAVAVGACVGLMAAGTMASAATPRPSKASSAPPLRPAATAPGAKTTPAPAASSAPSTTPASASEEVRATPRPSDTAVTVFELAQEEQGRMGSVGAVAVSLDGQLGLSADGRTITLWDLTSRKAVRQFEPPGGESSIIGLSFSTDSSLGVSGGINGSVYIWDLAQGEAIRAFSDASGSALGHGAVKAVTFIPNEREVLAGCRDGTVLRLGADSDKILDLLPGQGIGVSSLDVSADGKYMIIGNSRDQILFGETKSFRLLNRLPLRRLVCGVGFVSRSQLALSADSSDSLRLWDLQSGKELRRLTGHQKPGLQAFAVARDGRYAASGTAYGELILWDLARWQALFRTQFMNEVSEPGVVVSIAMSADGRTILAGGNVSFPKRDTPQAKLVLLQRGLSSAVPIPASVEDGQGGGTQVDDGKGAPEEKP